MTDLVSILYAPGKTTARLRLAPHWLVPFLVLAALEAGALLVYHQSQVSETLSHLPASLTSADRSAVASNLDSRLPARLLVHPVRLLLGWSVFALALFAACRAAAPGVTLEFRHVFALQVRCAAAETIGHWLPLLNSLNMFTLWYIILLIGGVRVLCAARPLKATLLVLAVWGSSLAFQTAVVHLLRDALHLQL